MILRSIRIESHNDIADIVFIETRVLGNKGYDRILVRVYRSEPNMLMITRWKCKPANEETSEQCSIISNYKKRLSNEQYSKTIQSLLKQLPRVIR